MTTDFLVSIVTAHILGDYFLQPRKMAREKSQDSAWCALHCSIYAAVKLVMNWDYVAPQPLSWAPLVWWAVIWASHFLIDRYSLADFYASAVLGGGVLDYIFGVAPPLTESSASSRNAHTVRGSFEAIVYVVIDNFAHLAIAWYTAKWFFYSAP